MTDCDYIQLVSSFVSMVEDKFNCYKCLSGERYKKLKEPKKSEMIYKQRKVKGCFDALEKVRYPTDHVSYFKCIGNFRATNFDYLMSLFQSYKKGLNPFGGPIIDAPNKFVEICNLLDNLITKHQSSEG